MPLGLPDFSRFLTGNIAGAGTSTVAGGGGHTAFGTVPAPITTAPNRFQQTSGVIPGLPDLTSGAAGVVGSELSGSLSPQTLNALKTASAEWGAKSGMGPGSGLETNKLFANIAGFSEARQHQGAQDYLSLLTGVGGQQTDQSLATSVSERNAAMAAAPDPQAAAEQQLALFDKYYNRGASAGGTPWAQTWTGSHAGGGTVVPGAAGGGGGTTDALGLPAWNLQSPDYHYYGEPGRAFGNDPSTMQGTDTSEIDAWLAGLIPGT